LVEGCEWEIFVGDKHYSRLKRRNDVSVGEQTQSYGEEEWSQSEGRTESKREQTGCKPDAERKQNGSRMEVEWKQNGIRMLVTR
jgi:hypothetical protein